MSRRPYRNLLQPIHSLPQNRMARRDPGHLMIPIRGPGEGVGPDEHVNLMINSALNGTYGTGPGQEVGAFELPARWSRNFAGGTLTGALGEAGVYNTVQFDVTAAQDSIANFNAPVEEGRHYNVSIFVDVITVAPDTPIGFILGAHEVIRPPIIPTEPGRVDAVFIADATGTMQIRWGVPNVGSGNFVLSRPQLTEGDVLLEYKNVPFEPTSPFTWTLTPAAGGGFTGFRHAQETTPLGTIAPAAWNPGSSTVGVLQTGAGDIPGYRPRPGGGRVYDLDQVELDFSTNGGPGPTVWTYDGTFIYDAPADAALTAFLAANIGTPIEVIINAVGEPNP